MHGRRRARRSPIKHLAEDGTLLKAGTQTEESEGSTIKTAEEEAEDIITPDQQSTGEHTHGEENNDPENQNQSRRPWWQRIFGG
tara:strand:- start:756 stop:1007 length:252 start_codon:yes stop_codon:yes gene_type:complete